MNAAGDCDHRWSGWKRSAVMEKLKERTCEVCGKHEAQWLSTSWRVAGTQPDASTGSGPAGASVATRGRS